VLDPSRLDAIMPRLHRLRRQILKTILFAMLASPAAALAETQPSGPALWAVQDDDTTVYLFGTIHFLKPNSDWRTDEVRRAWAASDRLILEVENPEDQAAVAPLIRQFGLSPERPLSSLLPREDLQRFRAAATAMGADPMQLDAMRAWLAGVILSSAKLSYAGYDAASGVDVILRTEAREANKPIMGLETPEQQIGMLSSFPEAGQLAFLTSTIRDFDAAPVELEQLAEAWSSGDTDAIAAVTLEPMRKQSESLYQTLIVERNRRWAAQITALLDTPGVAFVAVGALHLSGEDGVPEMLRASGIRVIRLPQAE